MRFKIVSIIVLFSTLLFANKVNYVLNTGGLLDIRAHEKINTIGEEVKLKTGANIYLDVKGDNGINPDAPLKERIAQMKILEKNLVKDLKKPYVVLAISMDQKYANILMSDDFKNIIDRDDILDGYVIPLLAAKDKNILKSKVSAAALNGYAQIADSIASYKNIKLVSSIGSEGKVASSIWRVFMYTLVLSGIILYFIIVLREKKNKKILQEKDAKGEKNGND